MKLLIATTNQGKFAEFKSLLTRFECEAPPRKLEVVEDGKDYKENALKKAKAFFEAFGIPSLADDSGLEVDVLNGEPGLYSARFGGEKLSWPERWNYLFDRLKNFPQEVWSARFRCVLCYYDGKSNPVFFEGVCDGRIVPEPKGDKGFGYDPIFYSLDYGRTFGEIAEAEKAAVSHRALAAKAFNVWAKRLTG